MLREQHRRVTTIRWAEHPARWHPTQEALTALVTALAVKLKNYDLSE